jgi:hypothetical protein
LRKLLRNINRGVGLDPPHPIDEQHKKLLSALATNIVLELHARYGQHPSLFDLARILTDKEWMQSWYRKHYANIWNSNAKYEPETKAPNGGGGAR